MFVQSRPQNTSPLIVMNIPAPRQILIRWYVCVNGRSG
jgi:hypothetical protein